MDKANAVGLQTELLVAAMISGVGGVVFFPLTNQTRYDLVADVEGQLSRIQVKRATWLNQRIRKAGKGERGGWRVNITSRSRGALGRRTKTRYQRGDFDVLAAVCAQNVYLIPVSNLPVHPSGSISNYVLIKTAVNEPHRQDSMRATERWEAYLNNTACLMPALAVDASGKLTP